MRETPLYRLRDFSSADSEAIRRINDSELPNVTLLAPDELRRLAAQAVYFRVAETGSAEIAGFLLALDETASYSSLNFQWFKARYPRFTYVDRIVVTADAQGTGVGRLLYSDLLLQAAPRSPLLTCEVNLRPPNPGSLRFHKNLGFSQVGEQDTESGKKTVAMLAMRLTAT